MSSASMLAALFLGISGVVDYSQTGLVERPPTAVLVTGLVVVGPDEDSHGGLDELGAVTILNLGSCKYCKHNFSPDYFFAGPL